jgi:hypothetical protein
VLLSAQLALAAGTVLVGTVQAGTAAHSTTAGSCTATAESSSSVAVRGGSAVTTLAGSKRGFFYESWQHGDNWTRVAQGVLKQISLPPRSLVAIIGRAAANNSSSQRAASSITTRLAFA